MTQSIDGSIARVREIVGALTGIRAAPDGVPDSAGAYPFFVAWNGGGRVTSQDDSWQKGLWVITCQLHFERGDLYHTEEYASTFPELITDALLAKQHYNLDENCETFGDISVSNFKPLVWGVTPTVGYEITIKGVKIQKVRDT